MYSEKSKYTQVDDANLRYMRQDLFRKAGCSLLLLPVTIVVIGLLGLLGWMMFQYYFFGFAAAFVEPRQDPTYLTVLGIVILAILIVLTTTWRNMRQFYRTFRQYRSMRKESSRIGEVMAKEKHKPHDSYDNDLMLHAQEESPSQQIRR